MQKVRNKKNYEGKRNTHVLKDIILENSII